MSDRGLSIPAPFRGDHAIEHRNALFAAIAAFRCVAVKELGGKGPVPSERPGPPADLLQISRSRLSTTAHTCTPGDRHARLWSRRNNYQSRCSFDSPARFPQYGSPMSQYDAVPDGRSQRRRLWPSRRYRSVPLVSLACMVLITLAVTVLAHFVVADDERTLLSERAHEVNLVLTTAGASVSGELTALARDVGRFGTKVFVPEAQDQLATSSGSSASLALVAPSGASFVVVAAVGRGLKVGEKAPAAPARAMNAALRADALTASGIYRWSGHRAVGFAAPTREGLVVFRQTLLGPVRPPVQARSAPFGEVRVVIYTSSRPRPGQVLEATTQALPLRGPVVYVPLMIGATRWTTAVSAVHPLVGTVAEDAEWVALATGLAGSVLVFLLLEEMAYRRDVAVRALETEHRFAEALQRRLLPVIPAVEGLDVASSYIPGSSGQQVGGDWFDVFALETGRTALVIGDVMGHDEDAAAVMAQVRSAVRAYAAEDEHPSSVVRRTARHIELFGITSVVTMIYGVLDDAASDGTRTFRWANAGHPPPVLRTPGGAVVELPDGISPLLGAPTPQERPMATEVLPAGSMLLLYTDGLVEVRHEGLSESIGHLLGVVAEATGTTAADICQAVLGAQLSGSDLHDDVALVVVKTS